MYTFYFNYYLNKYTKNNIYKKNKKMKYINYFNDIEEYNNYNNKDIFPSIFLINNNGLIFKNKENTSFIKFPIYLYSEIIDTDFRRIEPNETTLNIIKWFDENKQSNGNYYYIPFSLLKNKIFIDNYPITELYYEGKDILVFKTDYEYDWDDSIKIIQYKDSYVKKGTIDIMIN